MAAIVSSVIAWSNPQIDGRLSVREVHTDDQGNVFNVDYMAAKGTDVTAVMEARIPTILAEATALQAQEAAESAT